MPVLETTHPDAMKTLNKVLATIDCGVREHSRGFQARVKRSGQWQNGTVYDNLRIAVDDAIDSAKGSYSPEFLAGIKTAAIALTYL